MTHLRRYRGEPKDFGDAAVPCLFALACLLVVVGVAIARGVGAR